MTPSVKILTTPSKIRYYVDPEHGYPFLDAHAEITKPIVLALLAQGRCVSGFAFLPNQVIMTLDTGAYVRYLGYKEQGLSVFAQIPQPSASDLRVLVDPSPSEMSSLIGDLLVATHPSSICSVVHRGGVSKQYVPNYVRLLQGDVDALNDVADLPAT